MDFLEREGVTCLSKDGKWIHYPEMKLPDNPDSGLITQDITCEWFDETLPGYRE